MSEIEIMWTRAGTFSFHNHEGRTTIMIEHIVSFTEHEKYVLVRDASGHRHQLWGQEGERFLQLVNEGL